MARKHNMEEVLKSLRFKNDCKCIESTIYILTDKVWSKDKGSYITNPLKKFDLGNSSWGKIDYLTKYCGYTMVKVAEFPKVKKD